MQKENKSKGVRKANSSGPMAEADQMVEEEIEMPECAHENLQIAPRCAAQMPNFFFSLSFFFVFFCFV